MASPHCSLRRLLVSIKDHHVPAGGVLPPSQTQRYCIRGFTPIRECPGSLPRRESEILPAAVLRLLSMRYEEVAALVWSDRVSETA